MDDQACGVCEMAGRFDVVLGGHIENAMIRRFDGLVMEERNVSAHPYYAALNRVVDRASAECADIFLVLAGRTMVPSADWNMPYSENYGPFRKADFHVEDSKPEMWRDIHAFAETLVLNGVLSRRGRMRARHLDFRHYPSDMFNEMEDERAEYEDAAERQYLERLLNQVAVAQAEGAKFVLVEDDLLILEEIADFVKQTALACPIDLPDPDDRRVLKYDTIGAILNFVAIDANNLLAVRQDSDVIRYSQKICDVLANLNASSVEDELISALRIAYAQSEAAKKSGSVYEFLGWIAKPLQYVPSTSAPVTLAQDAKDLVQLWLDRQQSQKGWALISVKMKEVSVREYLARKNNYIL